jgi:hypothetical protein
MTLDVMISYFESVLAGCPRQTSAPAFSNLFIATRWCPEWRAGGSAATAVQG